MLKNIIRPPFKYIGAKTKLLEWIYSFFPPHKTFVDVFGGTGVVTFNKIPSKNDVYNDINSRIVNFYSVLRDEYKRQVLTDLISLTPASREEFKNCMNPSSDSIEDARRFYVKQNQSFSACGHSFGIDSGKRKKFFDTNWNEVIQRIKNVTLENLPFERIFKNYDSEETLFYCDPPYVETYGTEEYSISFGTDEQKKLIKKLKDAKGYIILSSYQHDSLSELLDAGWQLETKKFFCTFKNSEQGEDAEHKRIECIYINPRLKETLNKRTLL